jgi:hypothetical protein
VIVNLRVARGVHWRCVASTSEPIRSPFGEPLRT